MGCCVYKSDITFTVADLKRFFLKISVGMSAKIFKSLDLATIADICLTTVIG